MQEYIKPGLTMIDIWYVNLLLIFKEYQCLLLTYNVESAMFVLYYT